MNFIKSVQLLHGNGISPYLITVENIQTYKLITGADKFDPYRGSGPGRAYGSGIFHIYTADKTSICSGEIIGKSQVPPKSLVGEYCISGTFIDYDLIKVSGFQENWRASSGKQRQNFSQQFTEFLLQNNYVPKDVIGSVWTSVSGERLGIEGRVYAITLTGEPNIVFKNSYEYS